MPFQRFVQTGRVAFVSDGPFKGKICSIVDCVDQKSVLVDGPETGVPRQRMRLSQLHLTKFKINFPFNGPTRCVRKAWKDGKIDEMWAKSRWAEKAANRKRRLELTDLERFTLKRAKSVRNKIRSEEYYKLLKRVFNPIRKADRNKRSKKRKLAKSAEKKTTKDSKAAASKKVQKKK